MRGEKHSEQSQNSACRDAECHCSVDRRFEIFLVLCPEILGNYNARANRNSEEQADQHENKRAGGVDCSQIGLVKIFSDDCRVGSVVKLLTEVSDEKRNGEKNQFFYYTALGEQLFFVTYQGCLLLFA